MPAVRTVVGKHHQILDRIVLFVPVKVMDNLWRDDLTAQGCLHDKDVLPHVSVSVGPMVTWHQYKPIPVLEDGRLSEEQAGTFSRAEPCFLATRVSGSTLLTGGLFPDSLRLSCVEDHHVVSVTITAC